jgi:hypothetical protein
MIQLFTPYAETIELSRLHNGNVSAQQAEQECRRRQDLVRIEVQILFTPTYDPIAVRASQSRRFPMRVGLRIFGRFFFTVRAVQNGQVLRPLNLQGQSTFDWSSHGNSVWTGARIVLEFDAEEISSDDVTVEVTSPDAPPVMADFDLALLR